MLSDSLRSPQIAAFAVYVMKRTLFIIGLISIIMISFVVHRFIFHIAFNESLYVEPYTLDYYLAINSKIIRDFPSIEIVGERTFHYGCGDGNKLPSNAVSYHSRASTQKVWRMVRSFVFDQRYTDGNNRNAVYGGKVFKNGDSHLEIAIGQDKNGYTYVRAIEIY